MTLLRYLLQPALTPVTLILAILAGLLLAARQPGSSIPSLTSSQPSTALAQPMASGIAGLIQLESSAPVFNMLYRYGQNTPAANGAYGPNITAPRSNWYVEYQRAGAVDVIDGVLRHDSALTTLGLHMFHFALAREASDGAFPGSNWPFHGTAMFLAEAAPALIVLQNSSQASNFASEVRWQIDGMKRAAHHMVKVVGGPGKIDDPTKNHRWYEAAIALGATGVLAGDKQLQAWSRVYLKHGIAMEEPNGVMPEDGGHDTGYQALGMVHAARYLVLLAHGALHASLYKALARAEAWELSRVRPDGTIDQQGDTRTAGCQERDPTGQCKTTFYATIFNALARWSVVAHNLRYVRAAYHVWLQNWRLVPGDVLPPPGLWPTPDRIAPGQWITVAGTRFEPLEVVRVYLGNTLEQTMQTDQIGSFGGHSPQPNAHFPIPSLPAGRYTITARGSFGTVRHATITVQ